MRKNTLAVTFLHLHFFSRREKQAKDFNRDALRLVKHSRFISGLAEEAALRMNACRSVIVTQSQEPEMNVADVGRSHANRPSTLDTCQPAGSRGAGE